MHSLFPTAGGQLRVLWVISPATTKAGFGEACYIRRLGFSLGVNRLFRARVSIPGDQSLEAQAHAVRGDAS
jgi:hypothetical protein